jgi:hypothetical protein
MLEQTEVDLASVTRVQQQIWAKGASRASRRSSRSSPIGSSSRWMSYLATACSTSPAGAATRRSPQRANSQEVTGIDFVPAPLERGRVRAAAELLEVEFVEGDAQELPFEELAWGTEERLRELFGSGISELRVERCVTTQRFRSPEHFLEFFCSHFGPVVEAFGRVEAGREEAFAAELKAVARKFARGRTAAITADYVEVVAVRA